MSKTAKWRVVNVNSKKVLTQLLRDLEKDQTVDLWLEDDGAFRGLERSSELHSRYRQWCDENEHKAVGTQRFRTLMETAGYKHRRQHKGVFYER